MKESQIIDFASSFINDRAELIQLKEKYNKKIRLFKLLRIIPFLGKRILAEKAYSLQKDLLEFYIHNPKYVLVYNWFYSCFIGDEGKKINEFEKKFNQHFKDSNFTLRELNEIKNKTPIYHQLKFNA